MSITKITRYRTSDGAEFSAQGLAEQHEALAGQRSLCYGLGVGRAPASYGQPFYSHSTFSSATSFVRSHQDCAGVAAHRYYRYKRRWPSYALVADSLEEITWQQVVEAQQREVLLGTSITLTTTGAVVATYCQLPAAHPVCQPTPARG